MHHPPPALAGYDPAALRAAAAKVAGTRWHAYADHDPYYGLWLKIIDTILHSTTGTRLLDLPEAPYRDWYDSGTPPTTAAAAIAAR